MDSSTKTPIILAGKVFEIPCLPFKKNREVVPAASFALKAVNKSRTADGEPLSKTAVDYIYLAVYEAVNCADPTVTRDVFDSWGISLTDMLNALMAVALQTGVLVRTEGDKNTSGEA